jgi:RNA polymerase sigma factor (sigma-70 family)
MESNWTGQTDEDLMEAFYAGVNPAFEELYRRYYPLLVKSLSHKWRARAVPPDLLEDAVDDLFLRIWETRDTVKNQFDQAKGPLLPWIGKIASQIAWNRSRDYRRKGARELSGMNLDVPAPEPRARDTRPGNDLSIDILDYVRMLPTKERDLLALWLTSLTYQELAKLPDQEQSNQLLVSPKNVTLNEIAEKLNVSVSQLHRLKEEARLRLVEYLTTKGYSELL